jgi:hypothetical protein
MTLIYGTSLRVVWGKIVNGDIEADLWRGGVNLSFISLSLRGEWFEVYIHFPANDRGKS